MPAQSLFGGDVRIGCCLLLTVIAIGSSVGVVMLRKALKESEGNRSRAVQAENDSRDKLWGSYLDQAHALRVSQRRGQRFESLQAIRKALALPLPAGRSLDELRNEAASALALPDVEVVREWELPARAAVHVAFSGTLECYAQSDTNGDVRVLRVADDGEITRLPGGGNETTVGLSPDGQLLGICDLQTKHLKVWRIADSGPVLIREALGVRPCWPGNVTFSADNSRVAWGQLDGGISFMKLSDGRMIHWPEKDPVVRCPAFSPSGRQMLYSTRDNEKDTLLVRDVLTGACKPDCRIPIASVPMFGTPMGNFWRRLAMTSSFASGTHSIGGSRAEF